MSLKSDKTNQGVVMGDCSIGKIRRGESVVSPLPTNVIIS